MPRVRRMRRYDGRRLGRAASFGGSAAVSPLAVGLVEFWKMDEASGARVGSYAGLSLTSNNGVTAAAGVINNAASFAAASSQSLSIASNLSLQVNGDWTWVGWFKANRVGGFFQDLFRGQHVRVEISGGGNTLTMDDLLHGGANCPTAIGTGTWYFGSGRWDATAQKFNVGVNAANLTDSAATGAAITSTASTIKMGANDSTDYYDGLLDGVGVWSRRLSDAEIVSLYNGGAGLDYPFQ